MDNGGAMENRAISSMVGEPKTRRDLYKTIQASNTGGSVSPNGTIEDIEELESRGLNPYWNKKNKSNNEISKQVSQRNYREKIKKNSRVEQIASTLRDSYKANAKELKGSELEDFEKEATFEHVKENTFELKIFYPVENLYLFNLINNNIFKLQIIKRKQTISNKSRLKN